MSDNPFMTPIFWLLRWCIVLCLIVVTIGMVPLMVAERFGGVGVAILGAVIVGAVVLYVRRRLPQRKREF
jgi:CDP-diglyceride synthetase